ncbi:hypothetical protein [Streptomyces bambusae]|uniref:Uncharacterized protein n=1 Tax=Streptomyces bambusae TaxID=1550616 RepID=A0ABS6Z2N9_9ACTN|nr:hypothetical protein [Streptomyces bambusae]MBW5480980.1 hypothetical protein [Streptomyces bambusae]
MPTALTRRALTSATAVALATAGPVGLTATPSHGAGPAYPNDMAFLLGGVTVTDVSVASVNDELQATFVTTDNRILHTIRSANGSWTNAAPIDLTGVTGGRTGIAITATYS